MLLRAFTEIHNSLRSNRWIFQNNINFCNLRASNILPNVTSPILYMELFFQDRQLLNDGGAVTPEHNGESAPVTRGALDGCESSLQLNNFLKRTAQLNVSVLTAFETFRES